MREATRLALGAAGSGVDVVVHPKKSAMKADFGALRLEVERAFEKVRASLDREGTT